MELVQLVGFIIKKFVTMHGHMNVKKALWSVYFGRMMYDAETPSSSRYVCFVFIAYFWRGFFFCTWDVSPERNVM